MIRDLHKPIDHTDIVKHSKKFDKLLHERQYHSEKEREQEKQRALKAERDLGKLKSSFLDSIL